MTYPPEKLLTFEKFLAEYGNKLHYELAVGQSIISPLFKNLQLRLDDILPR